jgi:3-methyladenine DNA glycosylase AlkC
MASKKFKDWFDSQLAAQLAAKIQSFYPQFDTSGFIQTIAEQTPPLELKARVELFADTLQLHLPDDYPQAIKILMAILGPEIAGEVGMFKEGYWLMPIAKFVEKFGLKHYQVSISAIKEITKRHTGEYCIRPFLEKETQQTLAVMKRWSCDANVHVRRLASEGVRPRLPWARKMAAFVADPQLILPILENLKDDDSRFVQKSVANNLNDILKDNYEVAISTLKQWSTEASRNRQWIIKHALRNQLKQSNPEAQKIIEHFA